MLNLTGSKPKPKIHRPVTETPKMSDPETPTETAKPEAAADFSASSADFNEKSFIDTSHLDGLPGVEPDRPGGDTAATGLFSKEEFRSTLCGGLSASGYFTGLDTLKAVSAEDDRAIAGCDALYETIYAVPSLHWMLDKRQTFLGRAVAIGAFFGPLAIGARAELRQKRAAAVAARQNRDRPRPADDPATDAEDGEAAARQALAGLA